MSIGKRIRINRKLNDLTMKELGDMVGISVQGIGNYERGDREPSLKILNLICEALDITLTDLLDDETHQNDEFNIIACPHPLDLDADLIDSLIRNMMQNNQLSRFSLIEEDYAFLVQLIKYTLKMNTIILTRKNDEIRKLNGKPI